MTFLLPPSQMDGHAHACWKCHKLHKISSVSVVKLNDEKVHLCSLKCFEYYSEHMKSKVENTSQRRSSTPLPFKGEFKGK